MALTPEQEAEKLRLEIEIEEEELALAGEAAKTPPAPSLSPPDEFQSAYGGLEQGLTLGFSDEIAGLAGAAGWASEAGFKGSVEAYKQARDEERARLAELQKANPKSFIAGSVVGSIPVSFGSSLPVLAGTGAVAGLGGAEGSAWDQAKSTALGGAMGAVAKIGGDAATQSVSKSLDALQPLYTKMIDRVGLSTAQKWLETQAGVMAEKAAGIYKTQGQREAMLSKLGKGKLTEGEIGKKLLEEGLVTSKTTAKQIAENVSTAQKKAGQDIKAVIKDLPEQSTEEVAKRIAAQREAIPEVGMQSKLKAALKTEEELFADQLLPAEALQTEKALYGAAADWSQPYYDPNAIVNRQIDEALKASMTAEQKAAYEAANRSYELLSPAAKASVKEAAGQEGQKLFRLGSSIPTALGGAAAGLPGAIIGAGINQYATKRAPAIIAGGTWNAAKIIERAPEKFKGLLTKALERGEKSVAATHFLLQQQDPEYNKAINEED